MTRISETILRRDVTISTWSRIGVRVNSMVPCTEDRQLDRRRRPEDLARPVQTSVDLLRYCRGIFKHDYLPH